MIIPVATEAEWIPLLEGLPEFGSIDGPMLVVAPHPDDETLAAGGLIAAQRGRGLDVTVVAVTDGEMAYGPADQALGALRTREQGAALARLGVSADRIVRLGLPDSKVASHVSRLVDALLPLVTAQTHILTPWTSDFHPDHEACGRAAVQVARVTGARLGYWFFWTWHRGTPDLLRGLELRRFPLTEELLLAKTEALRCHRSQLQRASGDPILPGSLLAPAQRRFEVFLPS